MSKPLTVGILIALLLIAASLAWASNELRYSSCIHEANTVVTGHIGGVAAAEGPITPEVTTRATNLRTDPQTAHCSRSPFGS